MKGPFSLPSSALPVLRNLRRSVVFDVAFSGSGLLNQTNLFGGYHGIHVSCASTTQHRNPEGDSRENIYANLFRGYHEIHISCVPITKHQNQGDDSSENIYAFCQQGKLMEALRILYEMHQQRMLVGYNVYNYLLQECGNSGSLTQAKIVHAHIIGTGNKHDVFIENGIINMYAKCGSVKDARQVFDKISQPDVVSWTATISGYVQNECYDDALKLFSAMLWTPMKPNQYTFTVVLRACSSMMALGMGQLVHALVVKTGIDSDVAVCNGFIAMYIKCLKIEEGRDVFDNMSERDVVSWNEMIVAYARHGFHQNTLDFFHQMQRASVMPTHISFVTVLGACTSPAVLQEGKQLHSYIVKTGFEVHMFVANSLITMYSKCGSIANARKVFDGMLERDTVAWTGMIARYAQSDYIDEALGLFGQMLETHIKLDDVTLVTVLSTCNCPEALQRGKEVHAHVIKTRVEPDISVENILITMYAKCMSIDAARKVFDRMHKQDRVSWNAIIAGYSQTGNNEVALKMFQLMQYAGMDVDYITFTCVLGVCANLEVLQFGKLVHATITKAGFVSNAFVGNAIITMYAKCGHIEAAQKMFQHLTFRDVVSWNAMITGFDQNGCGEEALKCLCQMQRSGVKANEFTFISVLSSCASLAALEQGIQVYSCVIKAGLDSDVSVANTLITMYAKCGRLKDSHKIFDKMFNRNVVTWNAIIARSAQHGYGMEALYLFEQMQNSGVKPDEVTFIGVLSACSHVGLLDEGRQYFDSMTIDHDIIPKTEHCACMVDLLGRAGCLKEAEDFIYKMAFEPSALVWRTFLGACRVYGNMELGKRAAERLLELEPNDAASYVLLSNIYAAAGRWDDRAKVIKMMKDRDVKKEPGRSWIEVKSRVHTFVVEDRSHPQMSDIYAKLDELTRQIERAGYVPDMNFILHDVEQEQKQHSLGYHSEKLAIAFGLISTPSGTSITIMKNLRVCVDCHTATKFISKVVRREIVLRDANRFHHFKDGMCSCRDYW